MERCVRDDQRSTNNDNYGKAMGEKIDLNEKEIIVLADYISGISIPDTAAKTGLSTSTVSRYRKRIKKFLRKNVDINKSRRRVFGLFPLVIESLVYHIQNRDKEVTLKVAQGLGLLAKDYEEFKEMLLAVAAVSNTGKQPTTANTVINYYNGLSKEDRDKYDSNLATIIGRRSKTDRF